MKFQKFLIGKRWNHLRIAPRFQSVSNIRVKGIHDFPLHHIVRRGKSSLHLIVDHAVYGKLALRAFHLIVPALLQKNIFLPVNIGVENRVEIHMHQILKILIVTACHGVHGLIGICHCIQKGI